MVAQGLQKVTSMQVEMRFEQPKVGGMIDLTALDMTSVNMQDQKIRRHFKRIAEEFVANREDPPFFINMAESDISGVDFRGLDLSNIIFSGVRAHSTVFINCILSDTQFEKADLLNADFRQADLYHTKFHEAKIDGANFSGAKMERTHGLGLARPDFVLERLGVAASIDNAILPKEIESYRKAITERIQQHHTAVYRHSADFIEYEEDNNTKPDNESSSKTAPVIGDGFFGSNWLSKKNQQQPD